MLKSWVLEACKKWNPSDEDWFMIEYVSKLSKRWFVKWPAKLNYSSKTATVMNDQCLIFLCLSSRSLSCQRITLHKNLFCSYVLNSAFTIVNLITVVNNPKVVQRNPVRALTSTITASNACCLWKVREKRLIHVLENKCEQPELLNSIRSNQISLQFHSDL